MTTTTKENFKKGDQIVLFKKRDGRDWEVYDRDFGIYLVDSYADLQKKFALIIKEQYNGDDYAQYWNDNDKSEFEKSEDIRLDFYKQEGYYTPEGELIISKEEIEDNQLWLNYDVWTYAVGLLEDGDL